MLQPLLHCTRCQQHEGKEIKTKENIESKNQQHLPAEARDQEEERAHPPQLAPRRGNTEGHSAKHKRYQLKPVLLQTKPSCRVLQGPLSSCLFVFRDITHKHVSH